MKNLLEKKLFPYVIKPGRYSGGEQGQIKKDPSGKIKYLHAYPDKYDIGQSYPGIQNLYHIINQNENLLCERVFAVDFDAEEIMRRENIELFSLESYRPAKDFDAFGFTLPYELVYTNILAMLDLANIPIFRKDRTDNNPLILAGGPTAFNPEPLADFIDIFFLGDAEINLPHFLNLLAELKNIPRMDTLKEVVKKIESVYIPELYDDNLKPKYDFVPEEIQGAVVRDLKPEYYPDKPVVPLIDITHRHLPVEIMRGCPQGCRYCMAGSIYRPVRLRKKEEILSQIEKQIKFAGYEEVSLLSLSSSDYPEIEDLATSAANRLEKQMISISLPSLRPGTLSHKLLNAVKKIRTSGLTISPEAGSERLRLFIRKDFPDEAVYDTADMAFQKGWNTLKLYFMVGLPTETDEDLMAIAKMVTNISNIAGKYNGKKTINVTLSPFVPKPHTPFQWDEIVSLEELLRRIYLVKKNTHCRFVNYKYPEVQSSILQGIIGRGDRSLGQIIYEVFKKGSRFEGWNENFKFDLWENAFFNNDINIEEQMRPIPFTKELPWRHIRKMVSSDKLQKERQQTSMQLKDYIPKSETDQINLDEEVSYGRSLKKVATRQTLAPTKNRIRIRWGKTDTYKYMGHLDNLRLIERAIRRSRFPIAFSQGYNPTMKISFGPPLPLGYTSEAEYIDLTLDKNYMNYMGDTLRESFPPGFDIQEISVVMKKPKSLSAMLNRVIYTITLENLEIENNELHSLIETLLNKDEIKIERQGKNKITEIDIRPAIYDLTIDDDNLIMLLGVGEGGYAKPQEVLKNLLGERYDQAHAFFLHRKETYRIDEEGNKIQPMDI